MCVQFNGAEQAGKLSTEHIFLIRFTIMSSLIPQSNAFADNFLKITLINECKSTNMEHNSKMQKLYLHVHN